MIDDWFWAARSNEPAGIHFIIENGQDALWRRVRIVSKDERCHWAPIHRMDKGAQLEDILDMMFTVVPTYHVNHNRFVFEAAKIPVFAKFLRGSVLTFATMCRIAAFAILKLPSHIVMRIRDN